jgi:2-polyprenyl-3-methyl-5-hydroxy-6-metoxy-1,4-benzoquinol methylase
MEKICDSSTKCSSERTVLFNKNGYPVLECKECGHRFSDIPDAENHLSNVYSDDYFFSGKEGYPNYLDEKDILYKHGKQYAGIVSKYIEPGKMLDVGCAAGFILSGFKETGWDCRGIEPNDTMASYGRNHLNLHIKTGDLETFETTEKFDLITMIQVIGHFHDLDKAIKKASVLLNPKGLIVVESWNMKSTIAALLGKHWHEYSPPSVVNWFSAKTLAQYFKYYGFERIAKGSPVKKINGKHALSLFEAKTPNFIFKKQLLRSLFGVMSKFTIIYPTFDLGWYIFKKIPVQ